MRDKEKVLIVDDNKAIAKTVAQVLKDDLNVDAEIVSSLADGKRLLDAASADYFVVVTGLVLEDAQEGEMVDYAISMKKPVIVLTSFYADEVREKILSKRVFDYIIEKDKESINDLIYSIKRVKNNRDIQILIVDDSSFFRKLLREMLESQLFQVFEAENGVEALATIEKHPGISLTLTDYDMPEMDGFKLVLEMRKKHSKENLAIIAISGETDDAMIPRFLKYGANDYIQKPIKREELMCRINLNLDNLELIGDIRKVAHLDLGTGLFNKRYFYHLGYIIHSNAVRSQLSIFVAVIEVNRFTDIKDKIGVDAADELIRMIGKVLNESLRRRSDVLARLSENAFCIISDNQGIEDLNIYYYGKIKEEVELINKDLKPKGIELDISIGICSKMKDSFDDMVVTANRLVNEAMQKGINYILVE